MASKALIPIKQSQPSPQVKNAIELRNENGRLVIEIQATIRMPIEIEPVIATIANSFPRLTRREIEVLELINKRKTNKEIAAALNVCERTVKAHVSMLLEKFKVRSRIDVRELTLQRCGDSVATEKL